MAQFINKIKVPGEGLIRHIVGFGIGDPGYDVLEMTKDKVPKIVYYYMKSGKKQSVSVTKFQGKYYIEQEIFPDMNSLVSQKRSCMLKTVSRDFLMETVMAYRAYRMLFNEYTNFRSDIVDALSHLECVYLGVLGRDPQRLEDLMERSGFHIKSVNFGMIKTREKICLSFDGMCFREDQIVP